jgi:membrane protease YdiL (CAAX protease family)
MRTDRSEAGTTLPAWFNALAAALTLPLVLVSYGAMGLVASVAIPALGLKPGLMLAELTLAAPGLLLIALTFLLVPKPADALGWRPLAGSTIGMAVVAGLTLWVASAGLMETQSSFWTPPPGYIEQFRGLHELLRPRNALDAVFSVAAIALAPAICEEILFRGVVLPAWLRIAWPSVAVAVSAVFFGLIHVDTVATTDGTYRTAYRVPFALAVGLVLGLLRLATGSLVAPILAHAVLNTFTLAIAPYLDDPLEKGTAGDPRLGLALMLAGGLATALLLRRLKRSPPPK